MKNNAPLIILFILLVASLATSGCTETRKTENNRTAIVFDTPLENRMSASTAGDLIREDYELKYDSPEKLFNGSMEKWIIYANDNRYRATIFLEGELNGSSIPDIEFSGRKVYVDKFDLLPLAFSPGAAYIKGDKKGFNVFETKLFQVDADGKWYTLEKYETKDWENESVVIPFKIPAGAIRMISISDEF